MSLLPPPLIDIRFANGNSNPQERTGLIAVKHRIESEEPVDVCLPKLGVSSFSLVVP
jgi:hypothetical protein